MNVDGEAEVAWKVAADLRPTIPSVVATHDIPVFLHKENIGTGGMQCDAVDAMADLGVRVGKFHGRAEALIDGFPALTSVIRSEGAGGRDSDEDPLRVLRVEKDGVESHPSGAGLPKVTFGLAEAGKFVPTYASVR